MTFVAAAVPSTGSDPDARVLADAEDILVQVLFDDIVRTVLRPATARIPAPAPAWLPRLRAAEPPVGESRDRRRPAWARSPPGLGCGCLGSTPT